MLMHFLDMKMPFSLKNKPPRPTFLITPPDLRKSPHISPAMNHDHFPSRTYFVLFDTMYITIIIAGRIGGEEREDGFHLVEETTKQLLRQET